MKTQNPTRSFGFLASIIMAGALPLLLYWPAFSQSGALDTPASLPAHNIGPLAQGLVVITAFGVKPTYMLLSLAWIVWLWRQHASDLVALRWGLICFLGGEIACAVNYVFFGGLSSLTDYLHSYGMATGFSFVTYATLDGVDNRLLKYSSARDRCAALSLCRSCIKYAEVPCGLRRLFTLLIPALIAVALMLPCASLRATGQRTCIFNSLQDYVNPMWSQLFENRYCAWLSILLLLGSWAILLLKREDPVAPAKILFAAAVGPLSFGLLRLFLRTAYAEELVWSNVWEELTELIFVLGVGFVLWVFRQGLFVKAPVPAAAQAGTKEIAAN